MESLTSILCIRWKILVFSFKVMVSLQPTYTSHSPLNSVIGLYAILYIRVAPRVSCMAGSHLLCAVLPLDCEHVRTQAGFQVQEEGCSHIWWLFLTDMITEVIFHSNSYNSSKELQLSNLTNRLKTRSFHQGFSSCGIYYYLSHHEPLPFLVTQQKRLIFWVLESQICW